MSSTNTKPPPKLGRVGRELWRGVTDAYDLNPAEVAILRQACRLVDVQERIYAEIAGSALTVAGSTGQQAAHPLLRALAENQRVLDVLLRALALPEPDELRGRRRSPQAVAAAKERWRGGAVGV